MKKRIKIVCLCVMLLVLTVGASGTVHAWNYELFGILPRTALKAANKQPKILFVGNSFTHMDNFTGQVKKLANANGIYPEITQLTYGGHTLYNYVYPSKNNTEYVKCSKRLRNLLKKQKWDYVVLQPQSYEAILKPRKLERAVKTLLPLIEKAGAKPVLFLPWLSMTGHKSYSRLPVSTEEEALEMTQKVCYELVQKYGIALAPTGIAFARGRHIMPDIRLYASDDHHANSVGTYLSACVMYATLFGKNPEGTAYYPAFSNMTAAAGRETCMRLQALAADVTARGNVKNTARIKLESDEILIQNGTTRKLRYQILSMAEGSRVASCTSSHTKVATVSSDGTVTACGVGTTVVTVRLNNNESASCRVTVVPDEIRLGLGETYVLNSMDKVSWSGGNSSVAFITDHTVTAVKTGSTAFTGQDQSGNKFHLTVEVVGAPKTMTVERRKTLLVGRKEKLNVQTDYGQAEGSCKYRSSNPAVAEVSEDGILLPKSVGRTKIIVETYNGLTAVCRVTVLMPVRSIQFKDVGAKLIMKLGTARKLVPVIAPEDASVKTLQWKSSDPQIVAVNANGKIRAVSQGVAQITAKTTDGSGRKVSVRIKVE